MSISEAGERRPWLGLKPYGLDTKHLFFGRTEEIRELYRRVKSASLTVLYGQSGRGKSSLLAAGLVPRLQIESLRPQLIRLSFEEDDPPLLQQVVASLLRAIELPEDAQVPSLWELAHQLSGPLPALRLNPPVLIFDQFEEVFTLARPEGKRRSRALEVVALMAELAELVENRAPDALQLRLRENRELAEEYDFDGSPIRVVITLREEYLADLETFGHAMPMLMRNRMRLNELSGISALEAVVEPGRINGSPLVSDEVASRIVRFVAEEPDSTPIEKIEAVPPLLSLVCFELNEARIGTGEAAISSELVQSQAEDILQSFYDRSFAGLSDGVRQFVEDKLLTRSGHRTTYAREDAISELETAGVADADAALDRLIRGRLITSDEHGGLQRVELTHDVLAPLVLRSRNKRQERERAERAEREQASARVSAASARRERNRLRIVAVAMLALTGVAVWLALYAYGLSHEVKRVAARDQIDSAEQLLALPRSSAVGLNTLAKVLASGTLRSLAEYPTPAADWAVLGVPSFVHTADGRALLPSAGKPSGTTPSPTLVFDLAGEPAFIDWSRTGDRFLAGSRGELQIWSMDSALDPVIIKTDAMVDDVRFSPDGQHVLTASKDGTAQLWDSMTGDRFGPVMTFAKLTPKRKQQGNEDASNTKEADIAVDTSGPVLQDSGEGENPVVSVDSDKPQPSRSASSQSIPGSLEWTHSRFSPDGTLLAIGSDLGLSLFDARSGAPSQSAMVHDHPVMALEFSPDGKRFAEARRGGGARLWAVESKAVVHTFSPDKTIRALAFSPDGRWLLLGAVDGSAELWDVDTGARISGLIESSTNAPDATVGVAFDSTGRYAATMVASGTTKVWIAAAGSPTLFQRESASGSVLFGVQFRPGAPQLLTNRMQLWDFTNDASTEYYHNASVLRAQFSPDGEWILTAADDQRVSLWRTRGAIGPSSAITAGASGFPQFSRDGLRFANTMSDGTARVWDALSGAPISPIVREWGDSDTDASFAEDVAKVRSPVSAEANTAVENAQNGPPETPPEPLSVLDVSLSPNGESIATAAGTRSIRIWRADNGELLRTLLLEGPVERVFYFSDTQVAVVIAQNKIALVDVASGAVRNLQSDSEFTDFGWSNDGTRVATVEIAGNVRIWDASSGLPLSGPMRFAGEAGKMDYSDNGDYLAVASEPKGGDVGGLTAGRRRTLVTLWDARLGSKLTTLSIDQKLTSIALTADGLRLATASEAGTVNLWDTRTGQPVGEPITHTASVDALEFSPDGTWLATAAAGLIWRWNATTGESIATAISIGTDVQSLHIGADGRSLTVATGDGTAQTFPVIDLARVDAQRLAAVLQPMVDCRAGDNADTSLRVQCRFQSWSGPALVEAIDAVQPAEVRARLRYHLLSDGSSHPLLSGPGDAAINFASLRDKLELRTELIEHWWLQTGADELLAQWVLAGARAGDFSGHKRRMEIRELLRKRLPEGPAKEDLRLAEILDEQIYTLLIGGKEMAVARIALKGAKPDWPMVASDQTPLNVGLAVAPADYALPPPILASQGKFLADTVVGDVAAIRDVLLVRRPSRAEAGEMRAVLERHAIDDAVAQYLLAVLLAEDDLGGAPNLYRVPRLLASAAERGNVAAWAKIGGYFQEGTGGHLWEPVQAQYWLKRAADAGNATAANNLAKWAADQGHRRAEVAADYRRAAEVDGARTSWENLARFTEAGIGVPRDFKLALTQYRKAAEAGMPLAMYELGLRLELGFAGTPDIREAANWYVRAGTAGEAQAAFRLGLLLERGSGLKRDPAQAAGWYRIAALRGDAPAHYALARVLLADEALRANNTQLAQVALQRLVDASNALTGETPILDRTELPWLAGEARVLSTQLGLTLPAIQLFCTYNNDGACDVPGLCPVGSDLADCASSLQQAAGQSETRGTTLKPSVSDLQAAALTACREQQMKSGADPATVLFDAWEMKPDTETPRALLTLRIGPSQFAECEVALGSEIRVIRLEFNF